MVLSKLVVNIYTVLLEVGLWFMLVIGLIGGWAYHGFLGAVFGLITAAISGAVVFGAFLVLADIRNRLKAIEARQ